MSLSSKKQQVSGSHESNISIKSNGASHLYFDGNPSKWLQGHNLFGSNNLIALMEYVPRRDIALRLTEIFH